MQAHYEPSMSVKEDDILRLKNLLPARKSTTDPVGLQVASITMSHEVQMRVQHA